MKRVPTKRGSRESSRRAIGGFSVLELMVAAGITVVIAGFIAVVVRGVSTNWSRAGGQLAADAQARLVLDQLQLDLQSAIMRDDGNVWFAAEILDRTSNAGNLWTEAVRNPKPTGGLSLDLAASRNDLPPTERGKLEQSRYGKAGLWLRFFTSGRGSAAGQPVAVGYQIIRRYSASNPANLTNTAYLLHRAEVRPVAQLLNNTTRPGVLESGYNLVGAAYVTSTTNNNGTVTGDPRSLQVPGTNQGGSGRNMDAVIADNVIDFGIRCYVRDTTRPGGLRLVFPADANGRPGGTANSRYRPTLPSHTPPELWGDELPFPEVIDVMVRVLTEQGASLIANMEGLTPAQPVPLKYNNNAAQWWWGVAQENSRVYTRRIILNSAAF